MGVPRARRTKSKQGHRRSHLGLKKLNLSMCSKCGLKKPAHLVCAGCGFYKGREVVNVAAKTGKKVKRS